jgi:DNA repair exonuclease SbcCD ATPase subunit
MKARSVIQVVAKQTQENIEERISNIVSLALASVFPDPYEFKVRFVSRRNKTEADLIFIKRGHEGRPEDVAGGGVLDVASFALRIAVWSIKPTNNVLIQDEPFHFLSRNLQAKCSQMIKMINQKVINGKRLQFIIVSHIPEITEAADRIFNISNIKGVSKVSVETVSHQ